MYKKITQQIRNSNIYIFSEIIMFIYSIIEILTKNKINYIVLSALVIIIIVHICITINKKKVKTDFSNNIKFMIEFIENIGYTKANKRKVFEDNNCKVNYIEKKYFINGTNAKLEKEYSGYVNIGACGGLKIMICGGSSKSIEKLNIKAKAFDEKNNCYKDTEIYDVQEQERTKTFYINFGEILAKNDKFKVKYNGGPWNGSMREDYDGIVIGEHLLFDGVINQKISLVFENNPTISCSIFRYNYLTGNLEKLNHNIQQINNEYTCTITENAKDSVYFYMYKYL